MLSQPVVDLLAALSTGGKREFYKVSGASDFAAAKEDLAKMKIKRAAYVIPLADTAKPNQLLFNGIEQPVTEMFGVIMAIENLRDQRGDAVNADLEAKRKAVINELLGFVPEVGYEPTQYGGGRLLALDTATTWWQLDFITGYVERKV